MNISRIGRRHFLRTGSLTCATGLLGQVVQARAADEAVTPNLAPTPSWRRNSRR